LNTILDCAGTRRIRQTRHKERLLRGTTISTVQQQLHYRKTGGTKGIRDHRHSQTPILNTEIDHH